MIAQTEAVIGYCRVSGQDQVSRGEGRTDWRDGQRRQKAKIEAYAARHSMTVAHIYEDLAISGTKTLEKRDGLMQAIAHCKHAGITKIVVEDTTRLLRDAAIGLGLIAMIVADGIDVIDAADGQKLYLSNDDPWLKAWTQMKAIMAELMKNDFVLKTKLARDAIRAKGERCEGRIPFGGYPAEVSTLLRLRELGCLGWGAAAIAARLNEEKHSTRFGGPWTNFGVRKILKREARSANRS